MPSLQYQSLIQNALQCFWRRASVLLGVCVVCGVMGCGQKGPLVLPSQPSESTATEMTPVMPSEPSKSSVQ